MRNSKLTHNVTSNGFGEDEIKNNKVRIELEAVLYLDVWP